jgi:hypothetical protein
MPPIMTYWHRPSSRRSLGEGQGVSMPTAISENSASCLIRDGTPRDGEVVSLGFDDEAILMEMHFKPR